MFKKLLCDKKIVATYNQLDKLNKNSIDDYKGINTLISQYKSMRKFIKKENDLLISYNININRENKEKIQKTANYVGLRI